MSGDKVCTELGNSVPTKNSPDLCKIFFDT